MADRKICAEESTREEKMGADGRKKENANQLTIHNVRENVVGVNVQVPVLDGSFRTYVNFDNAASTPALRPVYEKVNEFIGWYSSVHRGTGFKSQLSTRVYDEAHEVVCRFVRADPATHVVIFGKNSTEALNKISRRYPFNHGDIVLSTVMEHHSNDLPWRAVAQVQHIRVDNNGALDVEHFDNLLKKYAELVRLVVVSGASNVTGYINPVHEIAEKAHTVGAEIVVDCAQLAPHREIDVLEDDHPGHLDYVVLSAHKMYAPYGTGAVIGKKDIFLQGEPDMVGGGTVDIVTIDDVKWTHLPEKEEAGSPNVVGAVALAQTMLNLREISMNAIADHEAKLTTHLLEELSQIERLKIYGDSDPNRTLDRLGVVTFKVEGMSHYLVAAILSFEGGIGVRNGCFCAHPYLYQLLELSPVQVEQYHCDAYDGRKANLPGLIRISFGCYNTVQEIDRLIELLKRIVTRRYQGEYVQDPVSGQFWPAGFQCDWDGFFCLD